MSSAREKRTKAAGSSVCGTAGVSPCPGVTRVLLSSSQPPLTRAFQGPTIGPTCHIVVSFCSPRSSCHASTRARTSALRSAPVEVIRRPSPTCSSRRTAPRTRGISA